MSGKVINVGFIGNPNCGKTTLFNAYTGANLKVANWPGVTVEKKEGRAVYKGQEFKLIDLPGIYSLTSYTMEEKVSRECIMSDEVDVIVDVADASSLERNLYLTLQLIELGKPVVLALNMMDVVEERGMEIDLHRLPEMLGIPAIPVSARKRSGLEILMHAVAHHNEYAKPGPFIHHHSDKTGHKHDHHSEYAMVYDDVIEDKIDAVIEKFREKYPDMQNMRWHAVKALEEDKSVLEQYPVDLTGIVDRSYEKDIINEKYDFIEEVIEETLVNKSEKEERTDRVDRFLTGKWLGLPIFLLIMALVFFLTFAVGDWLKGYFETGLEIFSGFVSSGLQAVGTSPLLESLIVDGIISGVGGILTFLPNIFILFLALAFLEDSGYMARVAYVMDDIMSHLGLSGRAFLPMLLGFGCSVPAVMASRALEHKKDRLKTILVTPFMSCSARLPIYVLFSSMFFGKYAMLVCYSNPDRVYPVQDRREQGGACTSDRAAGIQSAECKDDRGVCVGKDKGLSDKGRNSHFLCVHCDVASAERGAVRICDGYYTELWRCYRKSGRTCFQASGARVLADRGSSDLGDRGKRSGGLKLQRALWDPEYYHSPRYGQPCGSAGIDGIRSCERICDDGILPPVCAMHGDHRDDPPGGGKHEDHGGDRALPAGSGVGGKLYRLPCGRAVPVSGVRKENADQNAGRIPAGSWGRAIRYIAAADKWKTAVIS